MTKADLISSLIEKKMREESNTDVFTYTKGLNDMYDAIENSGMQSSVADNLPLQEGDWFEGSIEDYKQVNYLEDPEAEYSFIVGWSEKMKEYGYCIYLDGGFIWDENDAKKTKLSVAEFLRRANNTTFEE